MSPPTTKYGISMSLVLEYVIKSRLQSPKPPYLNLNDVGTGRLCALCQCFYVTGPARWVKNAENLQCLTRLVLGLWFLRVLRRCFIIEGAGGAFMLFSCVYHVIFIWSWSYNHVMFMLWSCELYVVIMWTLCCDHVNFMLWSCDAYFLIMWSLCSDHVMFTWWL